MLKNRYLNNRGVTLIEVLAVTVLIVAIGAVSFSALNNALRDFYQGKAKSQLLKEAQLIESELIYVVRNTAAIPDQDGYLEIDEQNPDHYTFYSAGEEADLFSFELDGNKLWYTKGNEQYLLSESISSFILREEGEQHKRLVYTIILATSVNGKVIEISFEERSIYFPIWSY